MKQENEDIARKMQYILNMRPVFNKEALFSDGTRYYRNPTEPKSGEKVICLFNANDPRGKYSEACNITVNLKQGEIARVFSLKSGFCAAKNEFTLDSGDSVFLIVKQEEK